MLVVLFSFVSPSELHGPVDHDVVVAAVSGLEPDGLVKESNDRRDDEVVVLRRMVIEPEQEQGVELLVIGKIGGKPRVSPLPGGFLNIPRIHEAGLVREK